MNSELSRLRWRCRRGMRELDNLLTHYLAQHYAQASIEDQQRFQNLLELPDPLLMALLAGRPASEIDPEVATIEDYQAMERQYETLLATLRKYR